MRLYQNTTYIGGKKHKTNYSVRLLFGDRMMTFPLGTNKKREAKELAQFVRECGYKASLVPDNKKAYLKETYEKLQLFSKLTDTFYETKEVSFSTLYKKMIKSKIEANIIKSNRTKEIYLEMLKHCEKAWGDINLEELNWEQEDKLYSYFNKKNFSITTQNMYKRCIKSFLNWCKKREIIERLPFSPQQIKITNTKPSWIKPKEFQMLQEHTDDAVMKARNRLGYYMGLRRGEFSNMRFDKDRLIVIGKGNKLREIPVQYPQCEDDVIMVHKYPAKEHSITKSFKRLCRRAGLDQFNFHCLRHSFAHNCMLNDVSIFKLQTYLGHSSVSTTENYLKDFGLDYLNYTSRVNK